MGFDADTFVTAVFPLEEHTLDSASRLEGTTMECCRMPSPKRLPQSLRLVDFCMQVAPV